MIDDTQTQGGTFASLRGYIHANGGTVVGAYALTGKQYSVQLRLSKETFTLLKNGYSEIENWWPLCSPDGSTAVTSISKAELFAETFAANSTLDDSGPWRKYSFKELPITLPQ